MSELGLFHGKRPHAMQIPVCSRSGDIVEPLIKPQWFLKCSEMFKRAVKAADTGDLTFEPESYGNVWRHWLKNDRWGLLAMF